jgi:hypothetical protein
MSRFLDVRFLSPSIQPRRQFTWMAKSFTTEFLVSGSNVLAFNEEVGLDLTPKRWGEPDMGAIQGTCLHLAGT